MLPAEPPPETPPMSHRRFCTYLRVTHTGYLAVRMPNHPRADANGWVLHHIVIAEWMNGGPLPPRTIVHHGTGERDNNSPWNLFFMEDQGEHVRIHAIERQRNPLQMELWIGIEYDFWAARNPFLPRPEDLEA